MNKPSRKPVIGVMGPGDGARPQDVEAAQSLGRVIASKGWVLLTGGRPAGVMGAASKGCQESGGLVVGVLPGVAGSEVAEDVDVAIFTGMGSARNNINILSASVVVACGIGAGTASEIALAIKAEIPVVLLDSGREANNFFRTLNAETVFVANNVAVAVQHCERLLSQTQPAVAPENILRPPATPSEQQLAQASHENSVRFGTDTPTVAPIPQKAPPHPPTPPEAATPAAPATPPAAPAVPIPDATTLAAAPEAATPATPEAATPAAPATPPAVPMPDATIVAGTPEAPIPVAPRMAPAAPMVPMPDVTPKAATPVATPVAPRMAPAAPMVPVPEATTVAANLVASTPNVSAMPVLPSASAMAEAGSAPAAASVSSAQAGSPAPAMARLSPTPPVPTPAVKKLVTPEDSPVPTLEYAARFAAQLLKIPVTAVVDSARHHPEISGYYIWEPTRGGQALVIGYDGSVLFANSSVEPATHRSEFAAGRRTPIDQFV